AAVASTGDDERALQKATTGQALRERFQSRALMPVFLCALAEVHHRGGRGEEALATIAEALKIADGTEEHWMDAELWRLKGEVISSAGAAAAEVEGHYRRALEIAQAQGSRMFELRAATALDRHLPAADQRDDVHNLLASLYAWFASLDMLD